jgi:hypothetical protein
MRDFKFFEKGTVDMIDGETYATASFNDDTPEGVMGRRRLYHTNLPEYERQRMETMRLGTPERHRDIIRRINEQRDLNDNPIRLFQTTTVTRVTPKWWMKIKIFFQKLSLYSDQVVGIAVIATTITFIVILVISKLLNAW